MDDLELQRQDALDELSSRYARGVLSQVDFERTLREVRDAASGSEIRSLLHASAPRRNTGSLPADPGQAVTAVLTERVMRGNWLRHRYVAATCVLGSATLDLREAVIREDTRIHVVAVMGEVQIMVPRGVLVENSISAILAEHTDNSIAPSRGGADDEPAPRLILTGTAVMAEVNIV